ncbi:MAG TPA: hypothetical protein VIF83_10525 [Gemmatimonadaceae bacterium]
MRDILVAYGNNITKVFQESGRSQTNGTGGFSGNLLTGSKLDSYAARPADQNRQFIRLERDRGR